VTDRIELRGMRFDGRHGVLPEEATEAQPFDVDVVLELDLAAAGTTDDLARTIDYGDVFRRARALVEQGPHVALIETLAERIRRAGGPPGHRCGHGSRAKAPGAASRGLRLGRRGDSARTRASLNPPGLRFGARPPASRQPFSLRGWRGASRASGSA
jgi:dihydroneopterin aldolase